MTKWIIGAVVAAAVVGAGVWWYMGRSSALSVPTPATPVVAAPDTSDQTLAQAVVDIDTQLAANLAATSTSALPAQIDRTQAIAGAFSNLALKLAMRISALDASSTEAAALAAKLSELNGHLADVNTQSNAAREHVASATASASTVANTKAEYAKASADMRVARQDFAAARAGVTAIFLGLNIVALPAASTAAPSVRQ